ncbi:MAG: hypothetical protein CMJ35_12970 [Phycisphaerae bacterium]|nr:hypothetical protein [Phycisphaerae bacterium]
MANVPQRAADLIEIAAAVYVADQLAKRTGRKTQDYGDLWYRHLRMEIAVRDPDFWNQDDIAGILSRMLNFISGDNFEFVFCDQQAPSAVETYLAFGGSDPNPEGIEKVILFSGGVDSLGGAVQEIRDGRRIAMVSHKPAGHVAGLQKSLVKKLVDRASISGNPPLPVSVWCHKKGLVEQDHTQRTRSFLYVTLGAVVARIFGLDTVDFFENGVVSINLPLAEHELGARATRTTHPQTLAWYSQLMSAVFERKFLVRNDFLSKTKQDVIEIIKHAGQGDLIASSVSCMHTRETTKASPHCGVCSQCVSRRFAMLGVDGGALEPSSLYRHDVLTEPRKRTEDRIIAERFLGFAREIAALEDSTEFAQRYAAELGRVTRFMPIASSAVIDSVFDLHRRHAEQVNAVTIEAMQASAEDQYHGKIPDGSMLSFGFGSSVSADSSALPKSAVPSVSEGASSPSHPLSKNQLLLLSILFEAKALMSQVDMVEATNTKDHRLTRKTIGGELKELQEMDFVCYPKGKRSGVAITPSGRVYLAEVTAH